MGKQKNKSKEPHPFSKYLNTTEELLWVSRPPKSRWRGIIRGTAVVMVFTWIGVFYFLLSSAPPERNFFSPASAAIIALIVAGTIAFFMLAVNWLSSRSESPRQIYALTTERVLSYDKTGTVSLPLEDITHIAVFMGEGDRGSFSFSAFPPMWWPDVEEAANIKLLIEGAQEERLKAVSA